MTKTPGINPANPPKTKLEISHLNKAETLAWLSHLGVAHDPAAGYRPLQKVLKGHLLAEEDAPSTDLNIDIPPAPSEESITPEDVGSTDEIFPEAETHDTGIVPDGYSI